MPSPICIRVSAEERQTFKAAAARANKTLTRFIKDAALTAARKVEKMVEQTQQAPVHSGLPSYMRATIYDASRGGAMGYRSVARQLARHLASEVPFSAEYEEWQDELDKLADLLYPGHREKPARLSDYSNKRQDSAVLEWFDSHYPRIMDQIPQRRRDQFLEGIYEAADSDDENDLALQV